MTAMTKRLGLSLPLALTLALIASACSPTTEERAANEAEPAATEAPQASAPSLEGDWQVTAVDRRPLTQIFTMNASVTSDRFMIRSDCVQMNWDFNQTGPSIDLSSPSTVECQRGRTESENLVERVLGGVNMALFPGDGVARLSGHSGTLTMERR